VTCIIKHNLRNQLRIIEQLESGSYPSGALFGTPPKGRWRNDTQHNNTQHTGLICDTQHILSITLCIKCHYAECRAKCRVSFIFMLSVVMLNFVMLSGVTPG
jgi:hypothetical protein